MHSDASNLESESISICSIFWIRDFFDFRKLKSLDSNSRTMRLTV